MKKIVQMDYIEIRNFHFTKENVSEAVVIISQCNRLMYGEINLLLDGLTHF